MSWTIGKKRGRWTQDNLEKALKAIKTKEMSDYKAAALFGVPRRTLRRYANIEVATKAKLGRPFTLSKEQIIELCSRITRLADVGFPVTMKILRLCVYKYCKQNNITHQFSDIKQIASHKWARAFLKVNPVLSVRKSQNLSPARAKKLNKVITDDHFKKLLKIFKDKDIITKPERIFNMNENACHLHLGNEHGESVTVISCASAIGSAIPPMILYKGKSMKPEYADDLPPSSVCRMTAKDSMTSRCFVDWLDHFRRFKPEGHCLVIFDGAKCHLDYEIVETADRHDIVLYCLPSNTTHELQPLDKSVFRSFEHNWNQELQLYCQNHSDRTLTKQQFGEVFTRVWDHSMTPYNIKSGFRATGIYPYDPAAIPEEAFIPSAASFLPELDLNEMQAIPATTTKPPSQGDVPQPGTSRLWTQMSTDEFEAALIGLDSEDGGSNSSSSEDEAPTLCDHSFAELLPSPMKQNKSQNKSSKHLKESWYCCICKGNQILDMRQCNSCGTYVHEVCIGLTKQDKTVYVCPACSWEKPALKEICADVPPPVQSQPLPIKITDVYSLSPDSEGSRLFEPIVIIELLSSSPIQQLDSDSDPTTERS